MRDVYKGFRKYARKLLDDEKTRRSVRHVGPTPLALVYPNSYAVGMSSLGYQTIYRLLNEQPLFNAERAFCYEGSFTFYPYTLESQRSLRKFKIIAFSLAFELDYINVLHILHRSGIPMLAGERGPHDPLLIMGGVTTFYNPTVMAPVADVFVIGEGEALVPAFARTLAELPDMDAGKDEILNTLAKLPGFYVPAVHSFQPGNGSIKRIHADISGLEPACSFCVTRNAHMNMFMVEVGRGCGRGCRFCAAGHVYHPFRLWKPDEIISVVKKYAEPGDRIGLVGAALSDFKELDRLCGELMKMGHKIGLSSLRADRISNAIIEALVASDVLSVTLAPETGSNELRKMVQKRMNNERILESVELISRSPIQNLKIYYMIGLPHEKPDDLEAIAQLTQEIANRFLTSRKREIRVSINAFIPKPFTPFQWAAMATPAELKQKRKRLTQKLQKMDGVNVVRKSVREEIAQGVLSVGNPQTGFEMIKNFHPHYGPADLLRLADSWLNSEKPVDSILPWDFIEYDIAKEKLSGNWLKVGQV